MVLPLLVADSSAIVLGLLDTGGRMAGDIDAVLVPLMILASWPVVLWHRRQPQIDRPDATVQCLLKQRTPDDCPTCRQQSARPSSALVSPGPLAPGVSSRARGVPRVSSCLQAYYSNAEVGPLIARRLVQRVSGYAARRTVFAQTALGVLALLPAPERVLMERLFAG